MLHPIGSFVPLQKIFNIVVVQLPSLSRQKGQRNCKKPISASKPTTTLILPWMQRMHQKASFGGAALQIRMQYQDFVIHHWNRILQDIDNASRIVGQPHNNGLFAVCNASHFKCGSFIFVHSALKRDEEGVSGLSNLTKISRSIYREWKTQKPLVHQISNDTASR